MKQTYFHLGSWLLTVFFLIACSSDEEEVILSSPLKEVKALTGQEQIILSWTNPVSEPLSFVEVKVSGLTTSFEKSFRHEVNQEERSQVVIEVPDLNETYKIVLLAFDAAGQSYAPLEVKGKPYTNDRQIGMDVLLATMRIESVGNGVKFSWNNNNNISCIIRIDYTGSGQNQRVDLDARAAIPSSVVRINQAADFSISIIGIDEDTGIESSSIRTENLAPNKPYKLGKELWSVYYVSSQAATAGDGSAACAIDETPLTRWLSANKGAKDSIIIDMGKPVVVERVSLARYFGVADNSAWDVTFSVGNDPDLPTWEHEYSYANSKEGIFKIEFNRTRDGDQLYPLPEPITARYVKYRTDRISGSWWTHYGEISVYGYYVE